MRVWIAKKQDEVCRNCKYFYQHYVRAKRGFIAINAGHCYFPRVKEREPFDSCKYFAEKET